MGFFGRLLSGISKAASSVANVASRVVEKTIEVASVAVDKFACAATDAAAWAVERLSKSNYDSNSVESRTGVEQALADFRSDISGQAREAEEASITSAMSRFDELADALEDTFPELVDLVRLRQSETEDMLTDTIMNYVQEHISENDRKFQEILKMDPGDEKKKKMSERMQSIIDDAQDYFGQQLKQQIGLLNDELDVRLNQKINAQEQMLKDTEKRYRLLSGQQSDETLDIQKLEEECVPITEAAACIQVILGRADAGNVFSDTLWGQEDKNERMVGNRSGGSKRNRKTGRAGGEPANRKS